MLLHQELKSKLQQVTVVLENETSVLKTLMHLLCFNDLTCPVIHSHLSAD